MGNVMRIEIKTGTKDRNLMMIAFFEETSNCNPKSHTRVPTLKEVALVSKTLNLLTKGEVIE